MMVAQIVLQASVVLGLSAGLVLFWRLLKPTLGRGVLAGPTRLSVIIPARNEAGNLPVLLESLERGGLARWIGEREIIVVDDESTDGTVEVAKATGCRTVRSGQRPSGWLGKSWACWKGALAASGDLFLFLDADVAFEPNGWAELERIFAEREGLVSVQPYHRTPTAVERLSAIFNAVVVAGTSAFRAGSESPDGGFGPCMMIRRDDYFRCGGHAAVHGSLIEDMALGRECAQAGFRVSLFAGMGILSFRMYPGGLPEIVEGWTKNLSAGAASARRTTLLLLVLWLSAGIAAVVSLGAAFAMFGTLRGFAGASATLPVVFSLVGYLAYGWELYLITSRLGSFGALTSFLYPVDLLFFVGVFLRSLYFTRVRRAVRWKGRSIALARERR